MARCFQEDGNKEKASLLENATMMPGSAEATQPHPTGTGAFRVGNGHATKARNEKAVKSLKTNNPAKSLIRRI